MGEWIEHDGKGMPVKYDTQVLVAFGDGVEESEEQGDKPGNAGYWDDVLEAGNNWLWRGEAPGPDDIVRYRVVT